MIDQEISDLEYTIMDELPEYEITDDLPLAEHIEWNHYSEEKAILAEFAQMNGLEDGLFNLSDFPARYH